MTPSDANDSFGDFPAQGEIVFTRRFSASPEQVWEFLTLPEKRARWLAGGTMELHVGGQVRLEFDHAGLTTPDDLPPAHYQKMACGGFSLSGTITACDPPRLLGFTWGEEPDGAGYGSEVIFELTPAGNQTLLVLRHRKLGDDPGALISVSAGWHTHLAILDSHLAETPPPAFWRTHNRMESIYSKRLPRQLIADDSGEDRSGSAH